MLFFTKSKKITVDFFTNNFSVYENFPIKHGRNFIPEWWKNIETKKYDNNEIRPAAILPTLKRCPGMINTYKESLIMPLWTEIDIVMHNNSTWTGACSDRKTEISTHPSYQYGDYLPHDRYTHLKITSPWYACEKKGINFVVAPCSWDNQLLLSTYFIPTGIRSWKHTCSTNIHGFIRNHEHSLNLHAGMPIVHFYPMSEKKIDIKCHYDPDKFKQLGENTPDRISFSSSYYKKMRLDKRRKF